MLVVLEKRQKTYQNHAAGHGITHTGGCAELHVAAGASGLAEGVVHSIDIGETRGGDGVGVDELAALDVHALDGLELAIGAGGELSDDGHLALRVDLEGVRVAVVVTDVDAAGVPSAAVLVANTLKLALLALAEVETRLVARVRRNVGGARVSLPDIHLVAARALALEVGDAVDEGRSEALGIAVAGAVVGTTLVQPALGAVGSHLGEIQGAVHAAGQLGGLDIKGELDAREPEHLVLLLRLIEQVDTRGDEASVEELLHAQARSVGGDAELAVVGNAVHDAVFSAGLGRRAGRGIGLLAPVAAVMAP